MWLLGRSSWELLWSRQRWGGRVSQWPAEGQSYHTSPHTRSRPLPLTRVQGRADKPPGPETWQTVGSSAGGHALSCHL